MRNFVFGFLAIIIGVIQMNAQDVTLSSQAAVDSFGLSGTTFVAGNLTVQGADIVDLSPLDIVVSISNTLTISNNSLLGSLSGLNNLTSVGSVSVIQNNSLASISGFNGFSSANTVFISNNTMLVDLSGFNNLASVGSLHLLQSPQISDISGFTTLQNITTTLNIQNTSATQTSSLCGCEVIAPALAAGLPSNLFLDNSTNCTSPQGCNSVSGILSSFCTQDFTLNTQAEVDAFFCTSVDGNVTIESLNQISNLSALSVLNSISGDLVIRNINNLTSLDGLQNLQGIGGDLVLSFLPSVTDFSALDNLLSVNNVTFEFLEGITDLDILNSVDSIDNLLVRLNANIQTVSGFNNLVSANEIIIRQNPTLVNLNGFDGITSLTAVTIEQNTNLDECIFAAPLLLATNPPVANINNNLISGCCSSPMRVVSSDCFFQCPASSAIGNSLSFDGADDYANIDAALTGLAGRSDFTVEFWMKADVDNVAGPRSMMFSHNAPAPGDNKFLLILNGPSIASPGHVTIVDEDGGFEYTSSAIVGDDMWHHVAYSRDNGIGSLYIDGVLDGMHASLTTFAANDRLSLGQDFDGSNTSDFFNGNLADVRLWGSPRTSTQIMTSQASELSGPVEELVAYYKFENDGISPQLVDCSPNMYNGIRMGTTAPTSNTGGQGGTTDPGGNGGGPIFTIQPAGAELPQFEAEMPCIEDHDCSEIFFPELAITKSISEYAPAANGNVLTTFDLMVNNTGDVELFDLELVDDLVTQLGAAFIQSTTPIVTITQQPTNGNLTINSFYDGSNINILNSGQSLGAIDTFILTIQVELDVDLVSSNLSNTASISSNSTAGGNGVVVEASSMPVTLSDCFASVSGSLTCNTALQLSIDTDPVTCQGVIDPTTILEGEDETCFGPGSPLEGFFRVSLTAPNGSLIAVSDNDNDPLTTDILEVDLSLFLGQVLTYTLSTTESNPNSCSGSILIEDKVAPELTGIDSFMVTCLQDVSSINQPTITDNCGTTTGGITVATTTLSENVDPCGPNGEFLIITRTTTATDASGNTSDPFVQTITVKQESPTFPADVTFTCEEFAADNTIADPTAAGAGTPNVFNETNGQGTCNYEVSFEDEILSECGSTNGRFIILRTWTVFNNCGAPMPIDSTQTIKVTDMVDPVIGIPATVTIEANVASAGGHNTCSSSGLLPVPTLSDNCSGINAASLTVNTPAGQATAVIASGVIVGYEIPAPFLGLGDHMVTYTVMDSCGNTATENILVTVADNTPPVAVCDELTSFSLTNTSASALPAATLDDGSFDLCNTEVFFKVIRMDEVSGTPSACAEANVNSTIETNAGTVFFDDETFFCCEDIATNNNMVILRVFDMDPGDGPVEPSRMEPGGDLFGRFNDCMVEIMIEDKLAPQKLLNAPNRSIVCTNLALINQYTDLANTDFDAPIVMDACPLTTTLSIADATNSCGAGTISRTFTITDSQGNATTCTQTIDVTLEHDYSIIWPNDIDANMCQIGVFSDTLSRPNSLIENGCDLLAVSFLDQRFNTQNDGCYKILRTYDVINWCEWDGVSAAISIPNPTATVTGPRLDVTASATTGNQNVLVNGQPFITASSSPNQVQSVGRWSYTQHIKVYDNEDPVISNIVEAACNASTPTPGIACGQAVSVSFDLTDNCGNLSPVTYSLVEGASDTNGDGQISALELAQGTLLGADPFGALIAPAGSTSSAAVAGVFTLTGNYPIGNYVAVLDVRDQCGNAAVHNVPFTSEDCKPPTSSAIDITVGIMATGMIDVSASSVENPNSASFDACSPVQFSFSTDVTDTIRTFTCADIGNQLIEHWVTDFAGNQSFVTVTITIEDQSGHCAPPTAQRVIAGTVTNPVGSTVQSVNVTTTGSYLSSMTTASNGQFAFYRINNGSNVTVTPQRLDLPHAGITTFDLYLIGQHILGNSLLQTPEQLIAADANNNGRVSAFDITSIRRVLLGLDAEFANNTSWRFVDGSYVFPNPSNPWQEVFPEVMNYNNLSQDMMNSNFTAIKIGDLNNSAAANSRQTLAPRTLIDTFRLQAENAILEAGESRVITFSTDDVEALGYQLTLEWNTSDIEVVNVVGGSHPSSGFGTHLLDEGKLTMSHDGYMGGKLFYIKVRALRDQIKLSDVFSVGSSITVAEAFAKTGPVNIALNFNGESSTPQAYSLEQNRPNPFSGNTQIGFTMGEAGEASLMITDVTGRVVWRTTGYFEAGFQQIVVSADELPIVGLLNYTLIAGDFTATRKMVVVK